jgi:ketol-acid reductoisomerase
MPLGIISIRTDPALASVEALRDRTVAVIGFGNQGAAHAANLRDSGVAVVVANRCDSPNGRRAIAAGFELLDIPAAVRLADLVILALPDEVQPEVYAGAIEPALKPGAIIGFTHGFAIRYGLIRPRGGLGVVLVAPKGPGATLRELYLRGRGLPCLFAVHQPSDRTDAERIGLAWAAGIGCARSGIVATTFADETETDLFGEQSVLCGGMQALMLAAFEVLVETGYDPALAYIECCHEIKQVADLLYARGPAGMNAAISNTAEFGAMDAGARLIDSGVRERMRAILADVRSGAFASRLRQDALAGFPSLTLRRHAMSHHPIEAASETVRSLMPWLGSSGNTPDSPPSP